MPVIYNHISLRPVNGENIINNAILKLIGETIMWKVTSFWCRYKCHGFVRQKEK